MAIEIGLAEFTFDVAAMPEDVFRRYSSRLFDEWENRLQSQLRLPDYSLRLELEEGSLKGKARVIATVSTILLAIAKVGDVIGGLREISTVTKSVGRYAVERALEPFAHEQPRTRSRTTAGRLDQLDRLFMKVHNGEVDPHEAARVADALFESEPDYSAELRAKLREQIFAIPRWGEQIPLELDDVAPGDEDEKERVPPKRTNQPETLAVVPDRLRIEVWRDTKTGPILLRVIPL